LILGYISNASSNIVYSKDYVTKMPSDFENLASTPICPFQCMVYKNQIFSVQGHPEYTSEILRIVINKRLNDKIFSPDNAKIWLGKLDCRDVGVWLGKFILDFIANVSNKEN
jgi:GMP synthase-like glutamine amidotransferase